MITPLAALFFDLELAILTIRHKPTRHRHKRNDCNIQLFDNSSNGCHQSTGQSGCQLGFAGTVSCLDFRDAGHDLRHNANGARSGAAG